MWSPNLVQNCLCVDDGCHPLMLRRVVQTCLGVLKNRSSLRGLSCRPTQSHIDFYTMPLHFRLFLTHSLPHLPVLHPHSRL